MTLNELIEKWRNLANAQVSTERGDVYDACADELEGVAKQVEAEMSDLEAMLAERSGPDFVQL